MKRTLLVVAAGRHRSRTHSGAAVHGQGERFGHRRRRLLADAPLFEQDFAAASTEVSTDRSEPHCI